MTFSGKFFDFFSKFAQRTIKINICVQTGCVLLYLMIYLIASLVNICHMGEKRDITCWDTFMNGGEMVFANTLFSILGQLVFVIGSAYFGLHALWKNNVLELNIFILMSFVSVVQCICGVWACNNRHNMSICKVTNTFVYNFRREQFEYIFGNGGYAVAMIFTLVLLINQTFFIICSLFVRKTLEFNLFKRIGAEEDIRRKYRVYVLFKSVLKGSLLCSMVMFMGLQIYQWARVVSYKEVELYDQWVRTQTDIACHVNSTKEDNSSTFLYGLYAVAVLVLNILFIASFFRGYYGIQYEEKLYVLWYLGYSLFFNLLIIFFTWELCFCDNVQSCHCGTSKKHVNLFPMNMYIMGYLGMINIGMMVVMFVCGYLCIKNFGTGLKEHLFEVNEIEKNKKKGRVMDEFRSKTFEMSIESEHA